MGCASRDIGQPIPADQLYFPFGIAALKDGERNLLAILSTNFDQRFQTQQVSLLDADQLLDAILSALGVAAEAACASPTRPFFSESFAVGRGPVILDRVRVPGVGADLLAVPVPELPGLPEDHAIFVTDRFTSTLVHVSQRGGNLDCGVPGEPPLESTDCAPSRLTVTEAEDPFSLALGYRPVGTSSAAYVAVGHLFGYVTEAQGGFGVVTYFDLRSLRLRSAGEAPSQDPLLYAFQLLGAGGVSGLAFSQERLEPEGVGGLIVLPVFDQPRLELASVELRRLQAPPDAFRPVKAAEVRLETFTNATVGRGLAVHEDNGEPIAIASLRFEEPDRSFNSAVAVVELGAEALDPLPVLDVGEELGPPAVRPRRDGEPLFAYFGDLRADKVWIIDVTRDLPRVVGDISGRAPRRLSDGRIITARTLDGPTGFAFVRRGARTYSFVTNFAGSTLAVLDVSGPVPQRHCLLARIGRDIDPNDESEVDRL